MSLKSKAQSIKAKLKNLAKQEGVSYHYLEMSFLLERIVARLTSVKNVQEALIFKGGFVTLRVYQSNRYTADVDVALTQSNFDMRKIIRAAESDINDGVWFQFENEQPLVMQGELGCVRYVFRAGLGAKPVNTLKCRVVHVDVGVLGAPLPYVVKVQTDNLIFDQQLSWRVYAVEYIVAEKLHAMVYLGDYNSRSRDVFDLIFLLPKADSKQLASALKSCFSKRKTQLPASISSYVTSLDTKSLMQGWSSVVDAVPQAPSFQVAINQLVGELKKHNL